MLWITRTVYVNSADIVLTIDRVQTGSRDLVFGDHHVEATWLISVLILHNCSKRDCIAILGKYQKSISMIIVIIIITNILLPQMRLHYVLSWFPPQLPFLSQNLWRPLQNLPSEIIITRFPRYLFECKAIYSIWGSTTCIKILTFHHSPGFSTQYTLYSERIQSVELECGTGDFAEYGFRVTSVRHTNVI